MFKIFIETFKNSVYSKEFYRDLQNRAISESVYYYLFLVLLAAAIFSLTLGIRFLPTVNSFIQTAGPSIIKSFPDDLIVEIKNGQAAHNSDEPVMIPFPLGDKTPWRYAVVVDTKNPFSMQKFEEFNTPFLLTSDSIVAFQSEQQVKISSLKNAPNLTIDKRQIVSWVGAAEPFLGWSVPIMFAGLLIMGFFVYVSYFLRIILASLIIWVFHRIKNVSLPFKRVYQVAIHASTLPFVLIGVVLMLIPFDFPVPPFLFTIITVVAAVVNFSPPQQPEPPPLSR